MPPPCNSEAWVLVCEVFQWQQCSPDCRSREGNLIVWPCAIPDDLVPRVSVASPRVGEVMHVFVGEGRNIPNESHLRRQPGLRSRSCRP